ncbi:MAG: BrnT family toxin [Pyrinomonadaceae bacterium]
MESLFDFRGFDWDEGNAGKNLQKHDVTDGECEEIFFNAPLLLADDINHSDIQSRFAAFGITASGRFLTVVFTRRKDLLRVISARDMNRKERTFYKQYEKNTEI